MSRLMSRVSLSSLALSKNSSINEDVTVQEDLTKVIAFYLPQFHITEENNKNWGEGFTEWTNVAKAKPNYRGHYQPQIPRDLGFYDLSNLQTIERQVHLAREYGVDGFAIHYYWFSGKRLLRTPLDLFFSSDIDFKYCLCWANENWTKRWDGGNNQVIQKQEYEEGFERKFISDVECYLKDSRYIRVNDKPLLIIYRIKDLPNPIKSIQLMKEAAKELGIEDIEVAVVDFYDVTSAGEVGADSLVEFPPHKFTGSETAPNHEESPEIVNKDFNGAFSEYSRIIESAIARTYSSEKRYLGVMPGWDNTARRQNNPLSIINNTPELFELWLYYARAWSRQNNSQLIFVNAWNEWGEGAHLEPDLKDNKNYLLSILRSRFCSNESLDEVRAYVLGAISSYRKLRATQSSVVQTTISNEPVNLPILIKVKLWVRSHKTLYKMLAPLYARLRKFMR